MKTPGEGDNDNDGNSTTSSGMTTRSRHPKPMTVSTVILFNLHFIVICLVGFQKHFDLSWNPWNTKLVKSRSSNMASFCTCTKSVMTGYPSSRQTDRQTDRQVDRQTGSQVDRQTDR